MRFCSLSEINRNILEISENILKKYPLCDSCLGRLFSSYLRDFTNEERGFAIKTALVIEMTKNIKNGDITSKERLSSIASSLGKKFEKTLSSVGIERQQATCWLCGGKIKNWIELYRKAAKILKESRAESFVVGVRVPTEIMKKEDEILAEFKITSAESLSSEIRREVGKRIASLLNIETEFKEPGAVVLVDIGKNDVEVKINPILIKGRYLKLGRNISQVKWFDERYKNETSIEGLLSPLINYYEGSIVFHASGREDIDVRMLGWGRPFIVEIKEPKLRSVPLDLLQNLLDRNKSLAIFFLEGKSRREQVRDIKRMDSEKRKVYRVLAFSESPLDTKDIEKLNATFNNAIINQRTPSRVLHRRADIIRKKKVHSFSAKLISSNIIEAILETDGGLYIKELVSGDKGRTSPSFTDVLQKEIQCIELDVLSVLF